MYYAEAGRLDSSSDAASLEDDMHEDELLDLIEEDDDEEEGFIVSDTEEMTAPVRKSIECACGATLPGKGRIVTCSNKRYLAEHKKAV